MSDRNNTILQDLNRMRFASIILIENGMKIYCCRRKKFIQIIIGERPRIIIFSIKHTIRMSLPQFQLNQTQMVRDMR